MFISLLSFKSIGLLLEEVAKQTSKACQHTQDFGPDHTARTCQAFSSQLHQTAAFSKQLLSFRISLAGKGM